MKKALLLILALLSISVADAQQVSEQQALMKAQQFFGKTSQSKVGKRMAPRKAPVLTLANNRDEFFVFNDDANGGYVVISGDERMPDVLAYSYDGFYDADNLPCNMQAWLDEYAEQVNYLRTHPEAKATKRTAPERENIGPLLSCAFNQWSPYNDKCPVVGHERCPTGCVATAMAQIMHYWQWPKQTTEEIPSYTTWQLGIEMPAQSITTIDWDNILDDYNSWENYNEEQADAISTLMLLCGTSVEMNYALEGSGSSTEYAAYSMNQYFDYDDLMEIFYRDRYSADWEQLIYDEIDARRPILYSGAPETGAGHAFVLDGYENCYFHVNWGWGGIHSWVSMTDVEGWKGYTTNQCAVIGIQPAYGVSRYAVLDNGQLTLYYDKEKAHRSGTVLKMEELDNYKEQITKCVIDPSFANLSMRSLKDFFSGWSQLESIEGIENLNTSKVTIMERMFSDCYALSSLDMSGFKTDNVVNMEYMFYNCSSLTSLDVSGFKTDNATNMSHMFHGCSDLTSLDLSSFKTDNVKDMSYMFFYCSGLTSLDLSGLEAYNVTNMRCMFDFCSSLRSLDMSGFKTENVTDMCCMFRGCSGLTSLDMSGFKTENVTDMSCVFLNCSGLTSLDLSGFNTNNVMDMGSMFSNCSALTSLDLSGFKTDKVTNMYNMFRNCSGLTSLDLSGFNTNSVTNMSWMFYDCSGLTSLDVSGFKTDNVTNMSWMFAGCSNLTNLDVSSFNTSKVTDMSYMFGWNFQLSTIYASERWNMSNVQNSGDMFYGCNIIVGGAGTTYDWSHIDGEYARVDEGPSNPGYLTYKATKYEIKYIVDGREYKTYKLWPGDAITPEPEPVKETYLFSGWSEIPDVMPAHDVMVTGTFERHFDVGHVVKVINYIMSSNATDTDLDLYDMNKDGVLNIGDIILVVRNILDYGGSVLSAPIHSEDLLTELTRYTAIQFELKTDHAIRNIRLVENMEKTHKLMYKQIDDETYAVVIYSQSNELLKPENDNVIVVEADGGTSKSINIQNITAATPSGETASYHGLQFATGIQHIELNEGPKVTYDLNGHRLIGSRKGINIINGKKTIVR